MTKETIYTANISVTGPRIEAPEEDFACLQLTLLWSPVLCARHGPPAAMTTQRSAAQDRVHFFFDIQGWRTQGSPEE